jgi:hypothetical protein
MMFANNIIAFAITTTVLTMAPGLDTAMVLRSALLNGGRHGAATALGVATGCLCWGVIADLATRIPDIAMGRSRLLILVGRKTPIPSKPGGRLDLYQSDFTTKIQMVPVSRLQHEYHEPKGGTFLRNAFAAICSPGVDRY